ncbi:hypothetical protein EBB_21270 [Methylomonas sp. EbB]|uniref:Cytochrome c n=1 Tax=Methylomonas fluvii TaxID=1854564 RepID=A0ABR9DIP9_9GAMM|nr:hypothetical protein [Methylomonas fluvii]MBD9362985.1 hypothetical protein [Methylomonas fluvii]CAD6876171.1 hypothetical protein [Methylomonas fluvii]
MRKTIYLFGIGLVLSSSAVIAESEFDFEELMNDVETKIQEVQNNIAAKDANTAVTQAKQLQDEFKLVEEFFAKRGNADDATHNAKEYQDKAANIQNALAAGDFDTAAVAANDFSKQCRGACHDKYKPL